MKIKLFAIYDTKVEAFAQPFFVQTAGAALRSFSDLVNDPQSNVNKHPEDFKLFELGEYDEVSGRLSGLETGPTCLGIGVEYHKSYNEKK